MHTRHFLERSGASATSAVALGTHLLVVIDQIEARIYTTELLGSVPQRITRYDPYGFGPDMRYNQDESNGPRRPTQITFYDAVAKTLYGGKQILILAQGGGPGTVMKNVLASLKQFQPDLAERVVGSIVVDEPDLTETQLLNIARDMFVGA